MPNYVINEVIFPNVDQSQQAAILAKVSGEHGPIDFSTLLPVPINYWQGDTSADHEETFPGTKLDWCTANWSTKWNASPLFLMPGEVARYQPIAQTDTTLILTFQTAWSPAYGWILALFNTFHFEIVHNWLSEYDNEGQVGHYYVDDGQNRWGSKEADQDMQRHLMYLRYGVESFESDDSETITPLA